MGDLTTLQIRLQAAAYIIELLAAEWIFLISVPRKSRFYFLYGAAALILLCLGVLTGIPEGSLLRFGWFLLVMLFSVVMVRLTHEGDFFSLLAVCGAGIATQHIANKVTILLSLIPAIGQRVQMVPFSSVLVEIPVFVAVYLLTWFFFGKRFLYRETSFHHSLLSLVIILICIGVNRLIVDHAVGDVFYEMAGCLYAIVSCTFALIIQFTVSQWEYARNERLQMERLLSDSEKQYEQWKTNVELVNVRFHDIKHMLDRISDLAQQKHIDIPDIPAMRQAIDSFSPATKTGNDTLDVLLRNMVDLCSQNQIVLHCVAYADSLKHFDGMSLYFLFANAIDNARENVARVTDPDKRIIEISIRAFGDSAAIHIWNYFTGTVTFQDGLPVPNSKSEAHGYGMKSIRMTVERLGGAMSARVDGEVFNLDIILPAAV